MGRQHSGESVSSYFMQGVIQFIMENNQFDSLKKNYQFVIIPFINLDGICYGNQRVNIAGADLDRVWKSPNQLFEP